MRAGTIHGVGLGPGAADLMSLRAARLVERTRCIAFFRKAGRPGHARRIVDGMLRSDALELAMEYPFTTEVALDDPRYNAALSAFYDDWAERLAARARAGEDVAVLCEGDPFFYGSFMHLHARLSGVVPVAVVPGITGMSAAWTATDRPVTWGDDTLTVLTGTLPQATLARKIAESDAVVVMKVGRHLAKLRAAIAAAGRSDAAWLVEQAEMPGQRVTKLAEAEAAVPYFSIVVIHGSGRRP